jgi:CRP-like cAMP-binding protein
LSERVTHTYQDKYRERPLKYLADYLSNLLEDNIEKGFVKEEQVKDYLGILADNEIRLIQPNTPFLKMGEQSTFVDMVISGVGSVWKERGNNLVRIANVNAGDLIGDMGVLQEIPRTASIRADTYMHVLRIPGLLFQEVAILLKIFIPDAEGVLQRIWRQRDIVQDSRLFGDEVAIYLQNKIAQYAAEVRVKRGEPIQAIASREGAIFLGSNPEFFMVRVGDKEMSQDRFMPPVFGERGFMLGEADRYQVIPRKGTIMLKLDREAFDWIREVPVFKVRLKELVEQREIYIQTAGKA